MKKVIMLWCMVALLFGVQRVVVVEEFTATWCYYCPGAARGLDENYQRDYDSIVVIAYHPSTSDPFYIPEAATRMSYYSVPGYPTTWFDGVLADTGGLHYGTMYPFYRNRITTRLSIPSPLLIDLTCNYDTSSNTGTVNATIYNTTSNAISGILHFVIVENDIPYNWQGMTELDFVARKMLPDANGEAITIPANGSITKSRNFTISSSWKEKDCKIVVFVQGSNREIYQGAEIALVPIPKMEYYGMNFQEISGNNNGWAEPGEGIRMYVYGKNLRDGIYTGGASISSQDPYITITSSNPYSVSIGPGDVDTVIIVDFNISSSCPSPHLAYFVINFAQGMIDSIPFLITITPGFSDDIESGQNGWTHYGTRDNWHITQYKSHSPTHSWYSGVEGSWQYTNENDAYLVSPYFVVPPESSLSFWHLYSLETNWDFAFVEIDNGSNWWKILDKFTGTQSSWVKKVYSLSSYSGQTVRIRFRFISDYSITQEGWYVDDVLVPYSVKIKEKDLSYNSTPLKVYLDKNSGNVIFKINNLNKDSKDVSLRIYDIKGALLKDLTKEIKKGKNLIKWEGNKGVYFVKLNIGEKSFIEKFVLIK